MYLPRTTARWQTTAMGELVGSLQEGFNMGRHYQRGYLRCAGRKSGSYCWEFLWREDDMAGKRVRRTAVIGTIEQYPTKEEALDAVNGLRMQVNADRNRRPVQPLLIAD